MSFKKSSQIKLRLFCFHHAGGSAYSFRNWHKTIPSDVELIAIQLPGRDQRLEEAMYTHVDPLAEDLLPILKPYLDLPYVFFGHSMGVIISYELLKRIRDQNLRQPEFYITSGKEAPQYFPVGDLTYHLNDEEFCKSFLRKNYTAKLESMLEIPELKQLFLPQLKADVEIVETYLHKEAQPFSFPIVSFAGEDEEKLTQEKLTGWSGHTSSEFRHYRFPGDHFFIESSEFKLLSVITKELSRLPYFKQKEV